MKIFIYYSVNKNLNFSISSFRDIEQTERLLRSIYHPQNLYCIHIDTKSPIIFYQAIRSIANCFSNVWIASKLSRVKWGDISVIMSEINCMKDLLEHYRRKFKYFINLTGQVSLIIELFTKTLSNIFRSNGCCILKLANYGKRKFSYTYRSTY